MIELKTKNTAILELEHAKRAGASRRQVMALGSRASVLETKVAETYLQQGRAEDAAISFLSAASCMKDAHRFEETRRLLDRASVYAESEQLKGVVLAEHTSVAAPQRKPAEIFWCAKTNIRDNLALRLPQREAYIAAARHFSQSSEHAIIQLPVGCGKTGTMAILPFGIASGRSLVIAPNLEIRDTLRRNLDYSSPDCFYRKAKVLTNGGGPTAAVLDAEANLADADGADFVITNIQQLSGKDTSKWLSNFPPDYFDFILVDEGHHNVAESWQNVFEHFSRAKVTSFTATPLRSDGRRVEGQRIYHFPIAAAIREGYVKDLASRRLQPQELYFTYRGSERRHSLEEVIELSEETWFSKGVALSPECNRHIVDASIQCMNELRAGSDVKHQIIAAACSIDHAKSIRSLYSERNLKAEVIHSHMSGDEIDRVRADLSSGRLDAIVQVQMLGEGADYPTLGVAAILRPFRHMVPYVQFIGRIMRVVRQDAPGHPDNRGYVVSHVGLNVDRWWGELRNLDEGEQLFFGELANASREFDTTSPSPNEKRRFRAPMEVLEEIVERFVEVGFLPEARDALLDDVVHALNLGGIDLETLGLDREELGRRLVMQAPKERTGVLAEIAVQPQRQRQEARRRLNERVRSAASEVLKGCGMGITGYQLPRLFPQLGSSNNLGAAIVLINRQVQSLLGTRSAERDLLALEELERAYRAMDEIVDTIVKEVDTQSGGSDDGKA